MPTVSGLYRTWFIQYKRSNPYQIYLLRVNLHWLRLRKPLLHGETFQELQMLGQVFIERKEAEPAISPRLYDIPRVKDVEVRLPRSAREKK